MNPKIPLLSDPANSVQRPNSHNMYAENYGWFVRETDPIYHESEIESGLDNLLDNLKSIHCTYHVGDSSFKNWQGLSVITKGTKSYIDYDHIWVEWGSSENVFSITPESFYLHQVKRLSKVEIILVDNAEETKHFITILNEKSQVTREEIYEIEMRMFDFFETKLSFSILHLKHSHDILNLIKDKTVLYYKNPFNEF